MNLEPIQVNALYHFCNRNSVSNELYLQSLRGEKLPEIRLYLQQGIARAFPRSRAMSAKISPIGDFSRDQTAELRIPVTAAAFRENTLFYGSLSYRGLYSLLLQSRVSSPPPQPSMLIKRPHLA
ncbi:hypothetical protein CDAR_448711 [Caerostris darwini]|uniref:Uncharacterized protein n=1 Tax=Caerostris darwini TaxID=1538125 RepID=A0AAV4QPK1_9ARAC|nr:hypothetical protein CDAR_448711 [Caerostris darwini]